MEEGLQHVISARRIRSRKSKQLGETALKKLHKKLSKLCIRTLHLSLSLSLSHEQVYADLQCASSSLDGNNDRSVFLSTTYLDLGFFR